MSPVRTSSLLGALANGVLGRGVVDDGVDFPESDGESVLPMASSASNASATTLIRLRELVSMATDQRQ